MTQPRKPKGTPTGGQFAGALHDEATATLSDLDTDPMEVRRGDATVRPLGNTFVAELPGGTLTMADALLPTGDPSRSVWQGDLTINGIKYEATAWLPDGQLHLQREGHYGRSSRPTDAAVKTLSGWVTDMAEAVAAHPLRGQVTEGIRRREAAKEVERLDARVASEQERRDEYLSNFDEWREKAEAEKARQQRIADGLPVGERDPGFSMGGPGLPF